MELSGTGPGIRGDRDEDGELTRCKAHRTQGVVMDPRQLPAEQPRPTSEALASDVARDAVEPFCLRCHDA